MNLDRSHHSAIVGHARFPWRWRMAVGLLALALVGIIGALVVGFIW